MQLNVGGAKVRQWCTSVLFVVATGIVHDDNKRRVFSSRMRLLVYSQVVLRLVYRHCILWRGGSNTKIEQRVGVEKIVVRFLAGRQTLHD